MVVVVVVEEVVGWQLWRVVVVVHRVWVLVVVTSVVVVRGGVIQIRISQLTKWVDVDTGHRVPFSKQIGHCCSHYYCGDHCLFEG